MTHEPTITNDSVDSGIVSRSDPLNYVTEASTMRIEPGRRPPRIQTTLGNGQPFILTSSAPHCFKYRQHFGCIRLVVYND
jgi:hypothetical protein